MSPPARSRSLFESGIFSDGGEEENSGLRALSEVYLFAGSLDANDAARGEWELALSQCESLLKLGDGRSSAATDEIALLLARLIYASYSAGFKAGLRDAAVLQSRKARTAKQKSTVGRWKIIRRAIATVCQRHQLKMTASDAFAESIRSEVIEVARALGLSDLRKGTSARSIERHIATLLKNPDLLSAILQECG